MTDFLLSDYDKAHGLWLRLRRHFEERLAAARVRNDDPGLDAHETATVRGEIRVLKTLIRLDADRPIVPGNEDQP